MDNQVYDRNKLLKLAAWARMTPQKKAFVDPAAAGGGMPPGAPPMDPAAMGAPMDPAMMAGGAPPMPPEMMMGGMPAGAPMMAEPPGAAPPPPDPSAQAMGDQEMMRGVIRDEIQKALGSGEGGVAAGGAKKGGGNKFDDALRVLEDKMKEQSKIFVAALRNAGIEIPLADLYGIDKADGSGAAAGTPTAAQSQPGLSETLQTGLGGDAPGVQPGKVASLDRDERQIEQLTKLAQTKDALQRSALAGRLTPMAPQEADLSYLAGLFR